MPDNKRVLVDKPSSDDEIVDVLEDIPTFLNAFRMPFWHAKDCEEPDEENDAEVFLMSTLCTEPGNFDDEKIKELLKDEKNHLPVMEALECLLGYDLDMRDIEDGLESEGEVAKVRHIVALLPKWGDVAREERSRDSKIAKSE